MDDLQEELRLAREELARLKATDDKAEKIQMTSGDIAVSPGKDNRDIQQLRFLYGYQERHPAR